MRITGVNIKRICASVLASAVVFAVLALPGCKNSKPGDTAGTGASSSELTEFMTDENGNAYIDVTSITPEGSVVAGTSYVSTYGDPAKPVFTDSSGKPYINVTVVTPEGNTVTGISYISPTQPVFTDPSGKPYIKVTVVTPEGSTVTETSYISTTASTAPPEPVATTTAVTTTTTTTTKPAATTTTAPAPVKTNAEKFRDQFVALYAQAGVALNATQIAYMDQIINALIADFNNGATQYWISTSLNTEAVKIRSAFWALVYVTNANGSTVPVDFTLLSSDPKIATFQNQYLPSMIRILNQPTSEFDNLNNNINSFTGSAFAKTTSVNYFLAVFSSQWSNIIMNGSKPTVNDAMSLLRPGV